MKIIIRSLLFLIVFLLFLFNNISAQTFAWVKSITSSGNVYGTSISVDLEGNSYVTGSFLGTAIFDTIQIISYSNNYDIFITKYNPSGTCLWAKHIGNENNYDNGLAISTDKEGNVFVTGYFTGTINFGLSQLTSNGGEDIFLAKYDSKGNFLWAKHAGGLNKDNGYAISIDTKGNSYITGNFVGTATFDTIPLTSYGSGDIFLAKYDPKGNCLWAKNAGGLADDIGYGISTDTNGNTYITGHFSLTAKFGNIQLSNNSNNLWDIFVAKYDTKGTCLWAKKIEGAYFCDAFAIATDLVGNVYVTGTFIQTATFDNLTLSSNGGSDIFISKYDTNGKIIWAKGAGGYGADISQAISVDKEGNSFITGYFDSPALFDSTKVFNSGLTDIFIAKYDSNGSCLWAKQAGGSAMDEGTGISVDGYGEINAIGFFGNHGTFGTIQLDGNNTPVFITKILDTPLPVELSSFTSKIVSNYINLEWMTQTETNNSRFEIERKNYNSNWIVIGEVIGSGTTTSQKQYSFTDKSVTHGKYFYRLKQIDYNGQYKYSKEIEVNFSIPVQYSLKQNYPNPYNPATTINYQIPKDGLVTLKVYDLLGRKINTLVNENKIAGSYEVNFNASNLSSGIYFYKLEAGEFTLVRKMMVVK